MQAVQVRKKKKNQGRYHLSIYFIDHWQPEGKPFYFWSNKGQDKAGSSIKRLKGLVTGRWKNKVNWAGLYEDEKLIATFTLSTNFWQSI